MDHTYNELSFIDKLRYRWRIMKEERIEDKRQSIEKDDRIPVNKQRIINELFAERENKKNKAKSLPSPNTQPNIKVNNMEQYKVPVNTAEIFTKQQQENLNQILSKEINSEIDAYENIIELQTFLSYPHDNLPDSDNKINEKLYYIQEILGKDILEKGMQIYESDKVLKDIFSTISIKDRNRLKREIINNSKLSKQLSYLRYHPEESNKQTGEVVNYQAVYSIMVEKARENEYINYTGKSDEGREY